MRQARVAVYRVAPGRFEEVVEKARTCMLPVFQRHRGFEAYAIIRGGQGGEDQAISVSEWASRRDAEEAVDSAAAWVAANLADALELVQEYVGDIAFSTRDA
jgi:heme-degrading monooxygenase HmoA